MSSVLLNTGSVAAECAELSTLIHHRGTINHEVSL